jgi:hypothetical protein
MRLEIDCYHNVKNKIGNTGYFILEIRMILLRIIQVGMIIIGPT